MKVVILCGGLGTRFREETEFRPKPMTEIGGKPLLWHIMKIYSYYGFSDFVLCLGYKGYMIKEYFSHYFLHSSDVTFNLKKNEIKVHSTISEPWKITLVDTGQETMTGGRLKRVQKYVGDKTFMMTYGDGVADINIKKLVEFHKSHQKLATATAIQLAGKFGALSITKDHAITSFFEKPKGDGIWISGGFFVLEPEIFSLIKDDTTTWEKGPLVNLAKKNQLNAYKHDGFWK
ncbi:MAG: glucose-1-phosphate cytidylyltransferase, partial [Desulfobacterales bacterium]|nr:glucose-1-phosphate cytidylyltransferase [Desulfobacterales bacterium]